VQPRPRVLSLEPIPGSERAKVRILRQVATGLAIGDHDREAPDQPGIVRADGIDEVIGSCPRLGVQGNSALHFTPYNTRGVQILAAVC
jgi:hypothetical protein